MTLDLVRPEGLEEDTWGAITAHADRLERAQQAGDLELMIGTAKDLVETIAKAAVTLQGDVVESNAQLPGLLSRAHEAFDRQPGRGAAGTGPLKLVAQGAKSAIAQLPELRNRLGTGHGRLLVAGVEEEDARMCVDLALLWSRWALGRLSRLLAARPDTIVAALHDMGARFTRGRLRDWLADHLLALDDPAQKLIGAAVGHRAMRGTFMVMEEGVDACAEQADLTVWPEAYRAGLLQGSFLNRDGHVDANPDRAKAAAQIITPHPDAAELLVELEAKIRNATIASSFGPQENWETARAMDAVARVIPDGDAREAWKRISKHLDLE